MTTETVQDPTLTLTLTLTAAQTFMAAIVAMLVDLEVEQRKDEELLIFSVQPPYRGQKFVQVFVAKDGSAWRYAGDVVKNSETETFLSREVRYSAKQAVFQCFEHPTRFDFAKPSTEHEVLYDKNDRRCWAPCRDSELDEYKERMARILWRAGLMARLRLLTLLEHRIQEWIEQTCCDPKALSPKDPFFDFFDISFRGEEEIERLLCAALNAAFRVANPGIANIP